MSTALLIRDNAALSVNYTEEAIALKEAALDQAANVFRVTNADEQEKAVAAQTALADLKRAVEKARKECKEPVLLFGRKIDAAAKTFTEELEDETQRVSRLIGDFQQLELAKVRAAEAARVKELQEAERAREAKLAEAKSHDEREAIQEEFCQAQQVAPEPVAPPRVKGQIVKEQWEFRVTNIALLYAKHPQCVKLVEQRTEIRSLLESGVNVQGVEAKKVVVAGVRATREREVIDA